MPPCMEAFQARLDGCEQPGLEGSDPACSRGLELHELKGPLQPKPFCDHFQQLGFAGLQGGQSETIEGFWVLTHSRFALEDITFSIFSDLFFESPSENQQTYKNTANLIGLPYTDSCRP